MIKHLVNTFLFICILIGLVVFVYLLQEILTLYNIIPIDKDFFSNLSNSSLFLEANKKQILLSLLPPFGILLSALIASFSIMRTINNTNELDGKRNQNELSKYYVEKCSEGFKTVYKLLKDQNNNPSTWIEAARILKYTLELYENIKIESYQKIYHIKEFQYRHLLLKTLSDEYGNSLKTSFFFGIKEWKEKNTLEANKIATINNGSCGSIEPYEVTPYPKGAYIPESAIKVIFDFISYSNKFNDPLINEKINNLEEWKEKGGIFIVKEGAYKYLTFKNDEINKLKENIHHP